MLITATADLHGHLPPFPQSIRGKYLVIAGDLCAGRTADDQLIWYNLFLRWVDRLPITLEQVLLVWGNHDWVGLKNLVPSHPRITILTDSTFIDTEEDVWFYGSPWSKLFGRWAFMKAEEELARHAANIPARTDVLIVHGPPYYFGDLTLNNYHAGSKSYLDAITEHNIPVTITGHIHEAYGVHPIPFTPSTVYNVSRCDFRYDPSHPLVEIEVTKKIPASSDISGLYYPIPPSLLDYRPAEAA